VPGVHILRGSDGIVRVYSHHSGDPLAAGNLPSWCRTKAMEVVDVVMHCFSTVRDRRKILTPINDEAEGASRPDDFPNVNELSKRCSAILVHTSASDPEYYTDIPNAVRECGVYGRIESSRDRAENWQETALEAGVACLRVVRS
jgi:hypothetical protein